MSNSLPIRSTLAQDPDYAELVEEFVGELPARVAVIRESISANDVVTLRRAIHQLRGACGGYGFPTLTHEAAVIEERIVQGTSIDQLRPSIEAFVENLGLATAEVE